jgi:hypothetical protein
VGLDVARRGSTWLDVARRGSTWLDVARRGSTSQGNRGHEERNRSAARRVGRYLYETREAGGKVEWLKMCENNGNPKGLRRFGFETRDGRWQEDVTYQSDKAQSEALDPATIVFGRLEPLADDRISTARITAQHTTPTPRSPRSPLFAPLIRIEPHDAKPLPEVDCAHRSPVDLPESAWFCPHPRSRGKGISDLLLAFPEHCTFL